MIISLKYANCCIKCQTRLEVGLKANWNKGEGVWCLECPKPQQTAPRAPTSAKKAYPSKDDKRQMALNGMSEAKRAFFEGATDFTWIGAAKGDLRALLERSPKGLF